LGLVPVENPLPLEVPAHPEESFEQMLLRLARSATDSDVHRILASFCRLTLEHFHASTAAYWRADNEFLIGVCAEGHLAEQLPGLRVRLQDADAAGQVVIERAAKVIDHVEPHGHPLAASFHASSVLALPVSANGNLIGVFVLMHSAMPAYFHAELVAKAEIAVAHLRLLIEASRLAQASRESRRRSDILVRCAHLLQANVDLETVWPQLLSHLRALFNARAAMLATIDSGAPQLKSAAYDLEIAQLAGEILGAHGSEWLQTILAAACAAKHPASLPAGHAEDDFSALIAAGDCICAPLAHGSFRGGLVLLAPAGQGYSAHDRALLGAVSELAIPALSKSQNFARLTRATEEANRHWAEVFDAISDYIVVHDEHCQILRANRALAEFVGVRPEQINELNSVSMSALIKMAGDPGPHPCLLCANQSADAEYTLPFLDRHYLVSTARLPATDSDAAQVVHILKDITDRRDAELRYRELFDNIQEGLFFAANNGRFVEVNDALVRMLGYSSRDELLQVSPADLCASPETKERFFTLIEREGGVRGWQAALKRKDGTLLHSIQNVFSVRDADGQMVQFRGLILDITDLKDSQAQLLRERDEAAELQAKLMQAEKMAAVGQLVSGVAHEVNNPLAAILGFADLLLNDSDLPERAKKDLRIIMHEAQRTKTIVQNLLSFARQVPPRREPVYVNTVIRRTVQLRSYDLANNDVQLIENLAEPLPAILGDAHQLQQVCLNILNNAYDAVRGVGRAARIEIHTTRIGDAIEMTFRDNGIGIVNPERIFEPFFTTKEIGRGTGLGLSICYGIVQEHGGEIICRNNPEGEGATFTVRLPLPQGQQHAESH
jgi:PAS domain S-box-containing protein